MWKETHIKSVIKILGKLQTPQTVVLYLLFRGGGDICAESIIVNTFNKVYWFYLIRNLIIN